MSENDPGRLADAREREADELQTRSERLASEASDVRSDWERKRADEGVPGAPPPEGGQEGREDDEDTSSPAPQAPPPSTGPSQAETPAEGGSGPPADVIDDDD